MARGRKAALPVEEQLVKITEDIAAMESSLKELKKTKKELEEKIRQERLAVLDELISQKGLSLEEVTAMLNNR